MEPFADARGTLTFWTHTLFELLSFSLSGSISRRCGVVVLPMAFRPDADS